MGVADFLLAQAFVLLVLGRVICLNDIFIVKGRVLSS